jgi:pimeloyl-ACP methyl ester carboxylesterase
MKTRTRLLGLAALAAGAWAWPRVRAELDAARKRVTGCSSIADTRCGPIEYAQSGDGFPVLVVHGAGGGFDQGMELGREFAAHGFRVIAPSRFGYLRTPLPADASPEAQADAHAALLESLGVSRAAVVGASAGAPSALQFALRHPDRCAALVLLVPLVYRPPEVPPSAPPRSALELLLMSAMFSSDFSYWLAKTLTPRQVIERVLGTSPSLVAAAAAEEQARVRRMMDQILPVSVRAAGLRNDGRVASGLQRAELERITAPTLVASAEDDGYGTYAGARYTAANIAGARFVGHPTGGHVWVGRDAQLVAEIEGFLRGALPKPAVVEPAPRSAAA